MQKDSIGIITIPDYANYGNRLQNYALVKFFQKMGYQAYSIEMNDTLFYDYRNRMIKLWLKKYRLLPFVYLFNYIKYGKIYARHDYLFEKFSIKNLNVRYYPRYNKQTRKKLEKKYKYIVLGSDQIWNPKINTSFNMYFCSFFPKERKIPLAISFGLEKLDQEYADRIKKYIDAFAYISVREQTAKNILEKITNVDTTVLCDPTFLLTREEWSSFAKRPIKKIKKPFVFSFFLGARSKSCEKFINENFSDQYFIGINNEKNNEVYETMDPTNFLWYILNAEYVLTDSFHACVFSIIFNKNFIAFSRLEKDGSNAGMDSRVENLLKTFSLENRMYRDENADKCLIQNYAFEVDQILSKERNKYLVYLKKYGVLSLNKLCKRK